METCHGVRLMKGVHEVDRKKKSELLVPNLSRAERTLSKGLIVDVSYRNQLAIIRPEPKVAHKVALAPNISQVPCEKDELTGVDSREGSHAVDKSEAVSPREKND